LRAHGCSASPWRGGAASRPSPAVFPTNQFVCLRLHMTAHLGKTSRVNVPLARHQQQVQQLALAAMELGALLAELVQFHLHVVVLDICTGYSSVSEWLFAPCCADVHGTCGTSSCRCRLRSRSRSWQRSSGATTPPRSRPSPRAHALPACMQRKPEGLARGKRDVCVCVRACE